MTPAQSARLGELYEEYGDRLVQYACRKLLNLGLTRGSAVELAEDIAQEAWVEVARTGKKDLLNHRRKFTADETRMVLFARVKSRITAHFKLFRSREMAMDWEDPANRGELAGLMPDTSALPAFAGYLAPMVAELPERQREALLLHTDGLTREQIGDRMGCNRMTADRLITQALLLIKINNPELTNEPVPVQSLPAGQREMLSGLSVAQQAVLLRLDDLPRRALLLALSEDLDNQSVAARMGGQGFNVKALLSVGVPALRALATDDMAVAA
ncbi:RNA polymerase sigma factor [Streptomyces sp. NPDC020917]|uniref:RNA polymerase sigma factor n=1 Tax=Streptomyces sp. NPDC020917 TaxID=3365102 RepID=UPI00378956E4